MGGSQVKTEHMYSIELPHTEKPGESAIFVNPNAKPYMHCPLRSGAETMYMSFLSSVEEFSEKPCLGTRQKLEDGELGPYEWKSYRQVRDESSALGRGLTSLGLSQKNEDGLAFLGIFSINREEWILCDLACISQDITSVPLYDVLQHDSLCHIINLTNLPAIACSNNKIPTLISLKSEGKISSLRTIIAYETVEDSLKESTSGVEITLYSLSEVQAMNSEEEDHPPSPSSLYTLCFTSGSTGMPKGAMITHENMVANVAGIQQSPIDFSDNDVHISYLPLAHMYERLSSQLVLSIGAAIGFYGGNMTKIRDDLVNLQPTVFISVPRLFNKFYELIMQQINSAGGFKKLLLNRGLVWKMRNYLEQGAISSQVWDKLIFQRIQQALGGRVRVMIAGSAPIAPEVINFLKVVFSCGIVQGYGQTESAAGSFCSSPEDSEVGHVGGPTPALEIKLIDVPEMNYYSTDKDEINNPAPRGEILMRGRPVFKGYYKNPEQTQEALDSDGWLHTGDIGVRYSHNGAFKIIDRIKNFFKLAQGEYIASEKIETVYMNSLMISHIFVFGEPVRNFLIAIVVPSENFIRNKWMPENDIPEDTDWETVCRHHKLKHDIFEDMELRASEAELFGYQKAKKIHIEHESWRPGELLTPTSKLKRLKIREKYSEVISDLYTDS